MSGIYLGSLPGNTTEELIRNHFSKFGKVKNVKLRMSKGSHPKCLGYGKLFLKSPKNCKKVFSTNHHILGREIKCEPILSGPELEKKKKNLDQRRVFIWNIPKNVSNTKIEELFKKFGTIESAYRVKVQSSGKPTNFGYVTFNQVSSAEKALKAEMLNCFKKGHDHNDCKAYHKNHADYDKTGLIFIKKFEQQNSKNVKNKKAYNHQKNKPKNQNRINEAKFFEQKNKNKNVEEDFFNQIAIRARYNTSSSIRNSEGHGLSPVRPSIESYTEFRGMEMRKVPNEKFDHVAKPIIKNFKNKREIIEESLLTSINENHNISNLCIRESFFRY